MYLVRLLSFAGWSLTEISYLGVYQQDAHFMSEILSLRLEAFKLIYVFFSIFDSGNRSLYLFR